MRTRRKKKAATVEKKTQRHYRTHPAYIVVSVNPDGTVDAVYNSAKEAAQVYGINKSTVNRYCRSGQIGMGKKWFYEKDFRTVYMNCEMETLQFTLPDDYVPGRPHFFTGHRFGNGWEKKAESYRKRFYEAARRQAMTLNASGTNRKGAYKHWKAVVCLNDGKEFPSVRHASEHYDIPQNYIYSAIHRVGSTRNLKFRLKSQLENIKNII